ncbi:PL29 family lyase N-terminal domain-containing protein [Bacteroides uniformis]
MKGNENERLFTFLFFKFINLKFSIMNKKFLSVILFSALMVGTAGTFTSCKDYDDDIDQINKELTDIKSQVAALQNAVDNGKWITSVTSSADGLVITMNDGSTHKVTNGKDGQNGAQGEPGVAGDKVVIDKTTGAITINDEPTGFYATKNAETGKFAVPEIGEDGFWYVVNKEGKLEKTPYLASPISAVQDPTTEVWTLKVWDATAQKYQEIKLPTAASLLSDLILIDGKQDLTFKKFTYTGEVAIKDWKGPRALPADKTETVNIIASVATPVIQLNPTNIDGKELTYSLIDSKNNVPSQVELTATDYKDLITLTRAANANGLYELSMNEAFVSANAVNAFLAQFKDENNAFKGYAVISGNARSEYQLKVSEHTDAIELTKLAIADAAGTKVKIRNNDEFGINAIYGQNAGAVAGKINANEWYYVSGIEEAALYDMHLSVDNDAKTLFGIEIEEVAGEYKFRATKTPDNITKAGFALKIETVDNEGAHKTTTVWLGQSSTISAEVTYNVNYLLKAETATKNYFSIDLAEMRNKLGEQGTALWNTSVKLSKTTIVVKAGDKTIVPAGTTLATLNTDYGIKPVFTTEVKDNAVAVNTDKDAKFVAFQINNATAGTQFKVNTQYNAVITFMNSTDDVLNTINVNFTFTIPAITSLFEIDPGFVKEGIANCYLYADDFKKVNTTAGAATFDLNRIFKKYQKTGFVVTLDDKAVVTDNKKSNELADVANSGKFTDNTYVTLIGGLGQEKGYNQTLNYSISGKFANAWEYPATEAFTFKAKIMSPIEQGKVTPKSGSKIVIKATDLNGYKLGNAVVTGYTYNTGVSYKVLPDKVDGNNLAWTRNDIQTVTAKSGNELYFKLKTETPSAATSDNKGNITEGYFTLEGQQVASTVDTNIEITVKDIWNRTKANTVPVQITVDE